jgi:pimeloyl-ACP methyl ester carboxylesterase/DNA-binding winged helix-turn-helix (wHTH) protein
MIYVFDGCELDLDRYELRTDGVAASIEPQVFDVLVTLVRERDRVVTKEELLDQVWGNRFVSESALTSRVKAARRAIGDDGRAQRLIRTVHGRGYQFAGQVSEVAATHAEQTPPPPPAQEIRMCMTGDGVRLAYATIGTGPPLVRAAHWLTRLDHDWESSIWRHWLADLSSRYTFIRYDERGCGLSDWEVPDFSFEAWVTDLETVVDTIGLERFPLLGISQGGPVAIAYAVRHPERVSHLVLLGSYAQGLRKRTGDSKELDLVAAVIELVRLTWGSPDPAYRQMFVSRFLPEGTQEEWKTFDDLQRLSASPENAWRFLNEFADIDVSDLAMQVSVPTLVVCPRGDQVGTFEQSRRLAALIPHSRLVSLDSVNHLLPERDPAWKQFLAELEAFVPAGGST